MKYEPLTMQDFESLRKELLGKLLDKNTYKRELAKLLTKDMLCRESRKIRKDISDFREEINQKLDMLLSSIDGLVKLITNSQVEKAASEANFQRHEQWLEDYENLIGRLERKRA
ncbi:MAG: hypothetical protein JSW07_16580 [bacterium]|nr:MAG: hypothetical protein JSW07_16580 [bacterium]